MSRAMRDAVGGLLMVALVLVAAAVAIATLMTPGQVPTEPERSPAAPAAIRLSISNQTTIAVKVEVNGLLVRTVPPGASEDPVAASLPDLPWSVVTRSPSGRVLSTLTVRAGDVVSATPDASGHGSTQGVGARVDLSCGRLDVWSGPPLLGPSFIPGPSGDCD